MIPIVSKLHQKYYEENYTLNSVSMNDILKNTKASMI